MALAPLHAAACAYRIALGPRAGQKVLTWKDPALARSRQADPIHVLKGCQDEDTPSIYRRMQL